MEAPPREGTGSPPGPEASRSISPELPTGTVTFLFTDIEGSTRLVNTLGTAFSPVLQRHHDLLRTAFRGAGGIDVATEGDAFFVVFRTASAAAAGAVAAQRALADEQWPAEVGAVRVRMGMHTGEGALGGDNYVGLDVHRAARIAAAGHGGQVLLSDATRTLVVGSLPADVTLKDLGEHRLKDLDRPEHLFQLVIPGLEADFAPPRTLETPTNLPVELTSFVGREREVEDVAGLVRRSRLVTLTGPGGTGKTRLAVRVAERVGEGYGDGAFFVDLSPVSDPELVPATVARALGVREEAGRSVVESLEADLRDRRLLLVMDNFEQVLAATSLVGELLRAAPGISIVATSREPLHVLGEQEYPVPSLGLPDLDRLGAPDEVVRYDAVSLFVQRARALRPDFALNAETARSVAAICARLDGLPLAIELAAARVKLFAPEAILARLEKRLPVLTSSARDVPERQRTLRGAIAWSHDLLDPTERIAFRRLGVFVGGCTIESAEAVCDPEAELGVEMLDVLGSFVDKSLLRPISSDDREPRFRMLETIREYALERLAESEDAQPVRYRHQDHFAALAREAEPEILGQHQKEWLDRLDADRDNLRAAVQGAADDGRIGLALEMGAALWRFWQQRGHLAEGRGALEGLLGRPDAQARTSSRARALGGFGGLAYWQADTASAGAAYGEALEIERGLDDPGGLAEALYNAAFVATLTGDHATARSNYDESLAIYTRLGDQPGTLRVSEALVFLMFHQREFEPARELQEENIRVLRRSTQRFRMANALNQLGAIELMQGDFDGARASLTESFGIFREAGDMLGVTRALFLAAAAAVRSGDPDRAARLGGAARLLMEPLGDVATPMRMLRIDDPLEAARAALGDEAFSAAYEAGRSMGLDEIGSLLGR